MVPCKLIRNPHKLGSYYSEQNQIDLCYVECKLILTLEIKHGGGAIEEVRCGTRCWVVAQPLQCIYHKFLPGSSFFNVAFSRGL